jgi:hypothetical protein
MSEDAEGGLSALLRKHRGFPPSVILGVKIAAHRERAA